MRERGSKPLSNANTDQKFIGKTIPQFVASHSTLFPLIHCVQILSDFYYWNLIVSIIQLMIDIFLPLPKNNLTTVQDIIEDLLWQLTEILIESNKVL